MPSKILIIDDMADFRRLARAMLESEIEDVSIDELEGAADPQHIKTILNGNYDLILLDYRLQGHDGLSVQRDLREAGCNTPIILLTAYGDERLAVQALREGAYNYLSKSELDQAYLISSVREALEFRPTLDKPQALFGDNIHVKGYRPIELLGRGAHSMVYLAENEQDGKQVVLKLQIVSNVSKTDVARFMREYEIMMGITHKNIGEIYDQVFTEDVIYMLMEYLDGGSLKDRIQERKRFPENEAIGLMIQLFDVLHYIHENGVLHRDIKPANIVFRGNGTPVLMDFGIASKINVDETLTESGSVVGTPSYMSPEQALGHKATPQSDLYSMGVVFYEMLTGGKPIDGDSSHQTMHRAAFRKPRRLPPKLMHLQDIFDMLLAKEPENRFLTGKEVADVLRDVQQSSQPS